MGELGALFNPGMRHEIEERESKANRREEEGNARDGDLRIDLASGIAVINIPTRAAADAKDPASSDASAASAPASVGSTAVTDPVTSAGVEKEARPAPTRPASSRAVSAAARANRAAARSASASGTKVRDAGNGNTADKPVTAPTPSSKASRAAR